MIFSTTLLLPILSIAGQTVALPLSKFNARAANEITVDQLNTIIGNTSCSGSQFPDECRTAAQALPFVNKAFADYNITTIGEKAALLSLMSFESGGFQFNINHFPGRPGQGTRNMMMFNFIYEYAADMSEQAVALAGPDPNSPTITDDVKNAVRALVLDDELSFASAAWFYIQSGPDKVGCTADASLVTGLQAATIDGWKVYVEKCVGTEVTAERQAGYETALKALKA